MRASHYLSSFLAQLPSGVFFGVVIDRLSGARFVQVGMLLFHPPRDGWTFGLVDVEGKALHLRQSLLFLEEEVWVGECLAIG